MIRPIMFDDYDKISDDIIYLGSKLYLRMNVSLSNKYEKDGSFYRQPFHKEFKYDSKYSQNKLITVRRSFDYFLTFDKVDTKISISIRVQDMILLRTKLEQVSSWFNDDTFAIKNNQMIVYKSKQPIIIDQLLFDKFIQFDPIVIIWEQTGQQQPGVRITIGDQNISDFSDITIDKFFGLLYIIQTINMYQSAQILINYLQRPDFGTNLYEFEENSFLQESKEKDMSGVNNRQIGQNTKKRSFFDNIEKM